MTGPTYDEVWRERFGDPRTAAREARTAADGGPAPPATAEARQEALNDALCHDTRPRRVNGYVRRDAAKATARTPCRGSGPSSQTASRSTPIDLGRVMTR